VTAAKSSTSWRRCAPVGRDGDWSQRGALPIYLVLTFLCVAVC